MSGFFPTFRRIWAALPPVGFSPSASGRKAWTTLDREALLRLIAVAGENRLPLPPLLRAFGSDAGRNAARQIEQLARLLEAGVPIADAVEQCPALATEATLLALRTGTVSGVLPATVRAALESDSHPPSQSVHTDISTQLGYLFGLSCTMFMIVTFMAIKVLPTFNQIIDDFGVEQPPAYTSWIATLNTVAQYWWIVAVPLVLVGALFITLRFARVTWFGWLRRWLRRATSLQASTLLQNLSVVAAAGRPPATAISTLARYHVRPSIRHRLLFVRNELEHGGELWQTMRRARLIDKSEQQLLAAAQRVGNLPWALQQLAIDGRERRRQRNYLISQLAFPLCIVLLGAVVFWLAVSMFGVLSALMGGVIS